MTVYNIYTSIKTKTNHKYIIYEMELYKRDDKGNKIYALESTGKQPLQSDKKTLVHPSLDVSDSDTTSYILQLNLYHKLGEDEYEVLAEPMTAIIPLKGFVMSEKKWGISREFEYNETTEKTQYGEVPIYEVKITLKSKAFEVKKLPSAVLLDPFDKTVVEQDLKERLKKKYDFPYQGEASLCGPAVFFYCLLMDRSDLYKQVVKELWESGETKIGTLKIKPSNGCRHPSKFFRENNELKIPPIDWMTLASLRDSENNLFAYDSPDDKAQGITTAGDLKTWFEKSGAKILYDINTNITTQIIGPHLTLADLCRLNSYIRPDTHVVVLIASSLLIYGEKSKTKDHWIVWTDKLKLLNGQDITEQTSLTEEIQLELFSWGEVKNWLKAGIFLKDVVQCSFAAIIVSKIP